MIPRRYIEEWKAVAPWPNDSQVEQDLVIARALVEIFSDDLLKKITCFQRWYCFAQIVFTAASPLFRRYRFSAN
jgi:hypothetical protein